MWHSTCQDAFTSCILSTSDECLCPHRVMLSIQPQCQSLQPRQAKDKQRGLVNHDSESCDESPPPVVPTAVSSLFSSARERRSFEFFYRHTIHQLSGVLESSTWTNLLLQAAHHEAAVRHAAVALGALHEVSEKIGNGNDTFAARQYMKAIRFLMKPLNENGQQAADVALLTCILFIYFETLRGHYGAALAHVDGGVKILSSLQNKLHAITSISFSSKPYLSGADLTTIFMRLDGQAATILEHWHQDKIPFPSPPGSQTPIPTVFSSLGEARNALDIIRHVGVREIRATIDQLRNEPQKLLFSISLLRGGFQIKLKLWRQALDRFLQVAQSDFDQDSQNALHILKMWRLLFSILVSALGATDADGVWDSFMPQFKSIIEHASQVLISDKRYFVVSSDLGIVLPLYFLALKCRDGNLRRKAIELMKSSKRHDGIWSSHMAARLAERFVEVEERDLEGVITPKDLPSERRVAGISMNFDKDEKKAFLRYGQMPRPLEGATVILEEWIEW